MYFGIKPNFNTVIGNPYCRASSGSTGIYIQKERIKQEVKRIAHWIFRLSDRMGLKIFNSKVLRALIFILKELKSELNLRIVLIVPYSESLRSKCIFWFFLRHNITYNFQNVLTLTVCFLIIMIIITIFCQSIIQTFFL